MANLAQGQKCRDTSEPIQVPVGSESLGRVINVVGEPFDGSGPIFATVSQANYVPISPSTDGGGSTDSSSVQQQDILVTRTKALDLLSPYAKGGKIATSGVADAGQTARLLSLWS